MIFGMKKTVESYWHGALAGFLAGALVITFFAMFSANPPAAFEPSAKNYDFTPLPAPTCSASLPSNATQFTAGGKDENLGGAFSSTQEARNWQLVYC